MAPLFVLWGINMESSTNSSKHGWIVYDRTLTGFKDHMKAEYRLFAVFFYLYWSSIDATTMQFYKLHQIIIKLHLINKNLNREIQMKKVALRKYKNFSVKFGKIKFFSVLLMGKDLFRLQKEVK